MTDTIAMVGAGQAALQTADNLRRSGFTGQLVMIGEEAYPAYQRPPLSKKYLAGELPLERMWIKPPAFYETQQIDLRLNVRVNAIHRDRQEIELSKGSPVRYDQLLLATGAAPRQSTAPGASLSGIHVLRSIEDTDRIRARLQSGSRVVIVGGGYMGLEVAATCRSLGCEVDVIEMGERVMNRVVAPVISDFFTSEHRRAGVRIHLSTTVSGFLSAPADPSRVAAVLASDGTEYPADEVIVAMGVQPNIALAVAAGLDCENGIAIDETCRTSDSRIFAAGDCCSQFNPRAGKRIRLESVDNAFEQAKTVAANMLGTRTVHNKLPWFWSDQYDLKILIVGLNIDYDQVVLRGLPDSRSFSCAYLKEGRLIALDCINNAKDYMAAKKVIADRPLCDPKKLADPSIPLKDVIS